MPQRERIIDEFARHFRVDVFGRCKPTKRLEDTRCAGVPRGPSSHQDPQKLCLLGTSARLRWAAAANCAHAGSIVQVCAGNRKHRDARLLNRKAVEPALYGLRSGVRWCVLDLCKGLTCVPPQIVWGAPDVRSWVPDGSIVLLEDLNALPFVAQRVKAAIRDEALYSPYHRWRSQPLPPRFVELATHGFNVMVCGPCDEWYKVRRATASSRALALAGRPA